MKKLILILTIAAMTVWIFISQVAVFINFRIIWKSEWKDNVEIAKNFYQNSSKADPSRAVDFNSEEGRKILEIIKKTVLTEMIETEIIKLGERRLVKVADIEDLEQAVNRKMKEEVGSVDIDNLEKGVRVIYGVSFEKFKESVLVPQAYREAVFDAFEAQGEKKAKDWLNDEKDRYTILLPARAYQWDKEVNEVVFSNEELRRFEAKNR